MKKILVCEDEAAIRDFVVINLTRAGYDVAAARRLCRNMKKTTAILMLRFLML